jgi:glycosyltransferase involved in cell wall biosynthesis
MLPFLMIENILKIILEAEPFQLALLVVFVILFLVRLYFNLFFSLRIIRTGKKIPENNNTPLSVLLTIRNEEEIIRENLTKILTINNCDFEVVAIDDFSQDNTLTVLGVLRRENEKLKVSSLNQETRFSVKLAQNIAIKAAKNDWVILVPPSVSEFSEEWLSEIAGAAGINNSVIVNYSNIAISKGLVNRFYRIERFFQQFKSAGYILNGLPYVYLEENIAFNKNKYFELGGYGKKINEPFANLELLINIFIKKKQTVLLLKDKTILRKEEAISSVDYFNLLKRSFRIERHLSWLKRKILQFDNLTRLFLFPVLALLIILFTGIWPVVSILILILAFLRLFIIKILQNRLNERKIFISSLVYELIEPYFKLVYRWYFNRRSRNQKWRSSF